MTQHSKPNLSPTPFRTLPSAFSLVCFLLINITPLPGQDGLQRPQPVRTMGFREGEAAGPTRIKMALANTLAEGNVITRSGDDRVSMFIRSAPLEVVLNTLAQEMEKNVVASGGVSGQVSITLNNIPLSDALDALLHINGYRWVERRGIILVSPVTAETKLPPIVQGREVEVFRLNYASASDIDKTVSALLSPVGQTSITEIDPEDNRRTREELVVEDLPEYIARVKKYIRTADVPPAQVLIEAYVLQGNLRDDDRHGVNLTDIIGINNGTLALQANGLASATASPAFVLNLNGRRLDAIVELIKQSTDAKTLASPKVLAVNGQQARIQIGESLGYLTTTTTQTSTLQQVNILDLGVVLTVTPTISGDGKVLMKVKPEVSSGRINPTTNLPDSDTTEVESTVLMPSGHAMVIGGLITEEKSDQQSKLPWLGDVPGVGKLFQRRTYLRDRTEIIIALVPRVVPYGETAQYRHQMEVQRALSPIVYGPLTPVDRRQVEAELPSASEFYETRGKSVNCFPTPPTAYSPYNPVVVGTRSGALPTLPAARLATTGSGKAGAVQQRGLLPPVQARPSSERRSVIRQTSADGWQSRTRQ